MTLPEPLPGTHLAQVDCNGCGAYTLAVPHQADMARCSACWQDYIASGQWSTLRGHESQEETQPRPEDPRPPGTATTT